MYDTINNVDLKNVIKEFLFKFLTFVVIVSRNALKFK